MHPCLGSPCSAAPVAHRRKRADLGRHPPAGPWQPNRCSVTLVVMVPRRTHPGELAGLASRLTNVADEVGDQDKALSMSLLAASAELRRHLDERGHHPFGELKRRI